MKRREDIRIGVDRVGGDTTRPNVAIASPFTGQRLTVPRTIELGDTPEGESAVLWKMPGWQSDESGTPGYAQVDWEEGGLATNAIWAFLDLAAEDRPERFVDFARRYGVLGLRPYRLPKRNANDMPVRVDALVDSEGNDIWVPSITDGIQTPFRFLDRELPVRDHWLLRANGMQLMRYEPISEWRRWVTWFATTLGVSQSLRGGQLATQKEWEELGLDREAFRLLNYGTDIECQRRQIAKIIQKRFVAWSGLVPDVYWEGDKLAVRLALGGAGATTISHTSARLNWPRNALFPALVASMISIATAGDPVACCSLCGKLHPRTRQPRSDRRTYCNACAPLAARMRTREAARKRRAKGKQQQEIEEHGPRRLMDLP